MIALAVAAFGFALEGASASARDTTSTHTYLEADYAVLHSVVSRWASDEASIRRLDLRIHAECPSAGAGSPQSDEEQKLSTEVIGALWATVYDENAKAIERFARVVGPLRWSNAAIARGIRKYIKGLREMIALPVPDLCGDVRTWTAGGFKAVPSSTERFDKHVEAIEVKEVPQRLLAPYERSSDRSLARRIARLSTRYSELEFSRGQSDWNTLLELLALNQ